jgi:hypothetical protein
MPPKEQIDTGGKLILGVAGEAIISRCCGLPLRAARKAGFWSRKGENGNNRKTALQRSGYA